MHLPRRGFALMLVLIASAALFAMAIYASVLYRGATIEARAMVDRADALRQAHAAASLALRSTLTTPQDFASQAGAGSGPSAQSPDGSDPPEKPKPEIELPAIIREMLGDQAEEIDKAVKDTFKPSVEGGGLSGRNKRPQRQTGTNLPRVPLLVTPDLALRSLGAETQTDPASYVVTLSDAASVLNLNTADEPQLLRYFAAKGVSDTIAPALAAQIIDWRDEDSFTSPSGAEQDAYSPRGIVCRNAPFAAVAELLFLPSMSRDLFDQLRADFTTFGDGKIHAGTAPRAVLASVPGLSLELADAILQLRAAQPLTTKILEELLPISARAALDHLSVEPSTIVRIRVERLQAPALTFEGLAAIRSGRIEFLSLRPLDVITDQAPN